MTLSAFERTLQYITSVKLQELDKERLAYQTHCQSISPSTAASSKKPRPTTRKRLIAYIEDLLHLIMSWRGTGSIPQTTDAATIIGSKLELGNLRFWLQQAKYDPTFNVKLLDGWAETLEKHIEHLGARFDAAKLFGELCNEWLRSGDSSATVYQAVVGDSTGGQEESFEFLERKEATDHKEKLRSIIFDPANIDTDALNAYLTDLFSYPESAQALREVRASIDEFGRHLRTKKILVSDVKVAIKGLLASPLMNAEQRVTLQEFYGNELVLKEVAGVLNMRMASLESWKWPDEGLKVDMRRHMNDKFRAFTDPELVDGILLHHIGVAWQVKFKRVLRTLVSSPAWKFRTDHLSSTDYSRDQKQLEALESDWRYSIDSRRNDTWRYYIFMNKLQASADQLTTYDDLLDAPEDAETDEDHSPAAIKNEVLRIMTTECLLNKAMKGSHAMIRTDIEWFGPSLSHEAIQVVLEFFGVPKDWRDFFQAFLETPMVFSDSPPSSSKSTVSTPENALVRKRGTPTSYALSTLFGELVLFPMDFALNQHCNGIFLYRLHDDMWLWDSHPQNVKEAWDEMKKYAGMAGVRFNMGKTGSCVVGTPLPMPPTATASAPATTELSNPNPDSNTSDKWGLPTGPLTWSFLTFDPALSRFTINHPLVSSQIAEMKLRLSRTKSVFGWVNVYNKFMGHFMRGFGGAPGFGECMGVEHLLEVVRAVKTIQEELFSKPSGLSALDQGQERGGEDKELRPIAYLRELISTRFNIPPSSLPDGYFYFPISTGGLGLANPLVGSVFLLKKWDEPLVGYAHEVEQEGSDNDGSDRSNDEDEEEEHADNEDQPLEDGYLPVSSAPVSRRFINKRKNDPLDYDADKKRWEELRDKELEKSSSDPSLAPKPKAKEQFMPLEHYLALRSSWSLSWRGTYDTMTRASETRNMEVVPLVVGAAGTSAATSADWAADGLQWPEKWKDAGPATKWVVGMYAEGVLERFGNLQIVDESLIPIGMVELFRSSKMKVSS